MQSKEINIPRIKNNRTFGLRGGNIDKYYLMQVQKAIDLCYNKITMAEKTNSLQFIVNQGILYNKRDIYLVLRDLGYVEYVEQNPDKTINRGRGYIMRLSNNDSDPTLFISGRIYINVSIFDFMQILNNPKKEMPVFELVHGKRKISILPLEEEVPIVVPTPKDFYLDRVLRKDLTSLTQDDTDLPFDDFSEEA